MMEIKKDSNIFHDFKDNEIIVSKGITVNLIQILDDKKVNKKINITLEEGSKLIITQAIFNCENLINTVYLKRNAKYELNSVFYGNNSVMGIVNSSIHLENNSYSNMKINGAAINESKIICNGVVRIEKDAKDSQGYQRINGLLLDDASNISSEPILEIENNCVKCSHGCSISQIKNEVLFYMQSRGLSKNSAISLIVESMFNTLFTDNLDSESKKRIETLINKNIK